MFSRLRSFLTAWTRRERFEDSLDEEVRFHLDAYADDLVRSGVPRREALRHARIHFGSVEGVKDDCRQARGLRLADEIARDTKHAGRFLHRNPGLGLVAIATLGLSIGATVLVFSIVDAWLFRPLTFPEPDRLTISVYATRERPSEPAVFVLYRDYLSWKERSRSFESMSAVFPRTYLMGDVADISTAEGLVVTGEFFRTLGVSPRLGRTFSHGDETGAAVTVLSHGLWERRFGASEAILGTSVTLNDVPHEVVGVMPPEFDLRMLDRTTGFELWTVFQPGEPGYTPGGTGGVAVLGRLRSGTSIASARRELTGIHRDSESAYARNAADFDVLVASLQADNTRTVRLTLVVVAGVFAAAVTGTPQCCAEWRPPSALRRRIPTRRCAPAATAGLRPRSGAGARQGCSRRWRHPSCCSSPWSCGPLACPLQNEPLGFDVSNVTVAVLPCPPRSSITPTRAMRSSSGWPSGSAPFPACGGRRPQPYLCCQPAHR